MHEIDNFNFPIVRKQYVYELWGQVSRDLRRLPHVGIRVSDEGSRRTAIIVRQLMLVGGHESSHWLNLGHRNPGLTKSQEQCAARSSRDDASQDEERVRAGKAF